MVEILDNTTTTDFELKQVVEGARLIRDREVAWAPTQSQPGSGFLSAAGVAIHVDLEEASIRRVAFASLTGTRLDMEYSATAVALGFLGTPVDLAVLLRVVGFGHLVLGWTFINGPIEEFVSRLWHYGLIVGDDRLVEAA